MIYNKKFTYVFLVILLLIYLVSYIVFRQINSEVWEKDNRTYVIFPDNKILYYLYRPLVYFDGKLTEKQFHIGQHR